MQNRAAAERFVRALSTFGQENHDREGLCALPEGGAGDTHQLFGKLSDHWDKLVDLNSDEQRHGIFVVVNTIGPADSRKGHNITAPRALFADFDAGPAPDWVPLPDILVQSKRGPHYYWLLDGTDDLETFTEGQKSIAKLCGSDPQVHDRGRLMRLPGTVHHKSDPHLVTAEYNNDATGKTVAEVVATLRAAAPKQPAPQIATQSQAARKRLEYGCRKLASMPKDSGRNEALYKLAFVAKTFVSEGAVPREVATTMLTDAAVASGLDTDSNCGSHGIKNTINSAFSSATPSDHALEVMTPSFTGPTTVEVDGEMLESNSDHAIATDYIDSFGRDYVGAAGSSLWLYDEDTGTWFERHRHEIQFDIMEWYQGREYICATGEVKQLNITTKRMTDLSRMVVILAGGNLNPLDKQGSGIAFTNGYFDGDKLVPHSPRNFAFVSSPYRYDPDARSELFEEFLDSVFLGEQDAQAKQNILQEFVGASLGGVATRYRRAMLLVGDGSNGKSVFVNTIADTLFQDSKTSLAPHTWKHEYYRAQLTKSRFNECAEMPGMKISDGAVFKSVIAGDRVSARQPHGQVFYIEPRAGHLFATNNLPEVNDNSKGFWDRWLIVEFNRTFEPGAKGYDPEISEKLLNEGQGIVGWALRGLKRLLEQKGYTQADSVQQRDWRLESDPVLHFLESACVVRDDVWTATKEVYEQYKTWCDRNDLDSSVRGAMGLGRRLAGLKVKRRKEPGGTRGFVIEVKPRPMWE